MRSLKDGESAFKLMRWFPNLFDILKFRFPPSGVAIKSYLVNNSLTIFVKNINKIALLREYQMGWGANLPLPNKEPLAERLPAA
jgi:hypothetical protein